MRAGTWTQFRSFSKSFAQLEHFTRESLGSKISKQNLKEYIHHPGPSKPPLPADVITIRPSSDLWKALGFAVAVGVGSFTITYFRKYEQEFFPAKTDFIPADTYTRGEDGLVPVQNLDKQKITWETMKPIQKATVYLTGANALVYLMWKVKRLKPFMLRYFCSSFIASRSLYLPMLLRAFSHTSLLHFGFNMYLFLDSASSISYKFRGPDQFWAFYCTAAVFSSLTSLVHQVVVRFPMRAKGATGAIFALISYGLMQKPEARFSAVFDYSVENVLYGLLLFDMVCLALFRKGSRIFDHAGQLGGTLFGIFYALHGEQIVHQLFMGSPDKGSPVVHVYFWLRKKFLPR